MNLKKRLVEKLGRLHRIPNRIDTLQESLGRIESRLNHLLSVGSPALHADVEFKVYSQWGEDGIIDHLLRSIPIAAKVFVEFGVETYVEANTLFLLKHRYWSGLVIDGSADNIEAIRRSEAFWKYDLKTQAAFITTDNIDALISSNGISGDIGLLSVDIDGNDYWVWQAIRCISPRIVVAEYNSLFGPEANISTPYKPDFQRTAAHPSNMYYGASIAALTHQAKERGYSLVHGNSAGNNVFFVRNDCLGSLRPIEPGRAYVRAGFRESRAADGSVQQIGFADRQRAICHLAMVDVVSGRNAPLREFVE
jgi:hypothetical protein